MSPQPCADPSSLSIPSRQGEVTLTQGGHHPPSTPPSASVSSNVPSSCPQLGAVSRGAWMDQHRSPSESCHRTGQALYLLRTEGRAETHTPAPQTAPLSSDVGPPSPCPCRASWPGTTHLERKWLSWCRTCLPREPGGKRTESQTSRSRPGLLRPPRACILRPQLSFGHPPP